MGEMQTNPRHPDPSGGRFYPIPQVSVLALQTIPLGSEVLIFNMAEATVEDGEWSVKDRDNLISIVANSTPDQVEHIFVIYLPPPISTSEAVMNAVSQVDLGVGIDRNTDTIYRAIQSGWLTADDLTAILMDVASEAQKEVAPS